VTQLSRLRRQGDRQSQALRRTNFAGMPFTLAHATKRRLRRQFEQRGVRHFLPLYQEIPRWNNRSAGVSLPLFPGFVFVRTSNRNRYEPLQVPGVLHYVGTGAAQCPIPDEEIEVLRRVLFSGKDVGPHPYLRMAGQYGSPRAR
jgi:transcription antitermination factor NusG